MHCGSAALSLPEGLVLVMGFSGPGSKHSPTGGLEPAIWFSSWDNHSVINEQSPV